MESRVYKYGKENFNVGDIFSRQIEFSDLIGSKIDSYIKQGSKDRILGAQEIWIKLPNWGDVRCSWYEQEITFVNEADKRNKIIEVVRYLITSVKTKVVDGDNSGYKKSYFTDLCWTMKDRVFIRVEEIESVVECLLKSNTLEELGSDEKAVFFISGGYGE